MYVVLKMLIEKKTHNVKSLWLLSYCVFIDSGVPMNSYGGLGNGRSMMSPFGSSGYSSSCKYMYYMSII